MKFFVDLLKDKKLGVPFREVFLINVILPFIFFNGRDGMVVVWTVAGV